MTFTEIQEANAQIKTTDIKGKEYAEVNQRIKAFRMVCPNGSINTEIVQMAEGVVTMRATVTDANGMVLGVGHAQEKETSSYINKTSYIENCETSAVGRALGMCGFGIDTSVCSAEELQNALLNQEQTDRPKRSAKSVKPPETIYICSRCGKPIDERVYSYSKAKYGDALCRDCQKDFDVI